MKNLLLIIHKLSNGGAERAITNLANTLKDDYNVTMVVFNNSIKEYIPTVEVIDLKAEDTKQCSTLFYKVKEIKKIKKKLNIDCSISFLTGPNIVNCLTRRNEKVIISIRNMQSKLKLNFFKKLANQISLLKCDKVVAVSKVVENDLKKNFSVVENKITNIYNMIDNEYIIKKSQEELYEKELIKGDYRQLQDKGPVIITIGRLILQKGQWHLIKSFKLVVKKYKDAKLIILGRGELNQDFQILIRKLELENNVYLLDYKINPYQYLVNSDIFVSTSIYEGMPNVILEAMACNLPIIATDCMGGTKEILSPSSSVENFIDKVEEVEYGILIPKLAEEYDITDRITDEEKVLAKTMIDLFENKDKLSHYVQKSKERIKDFENIVIRKQWIDVIEE